MEQLRSSRILVLDDDPKEAMTVVQALQRMGLTALYHDGSSDRPVLEKMSGIRVLFVDMVLAAHGADHNDPAACAAMVVSALERVLEPNEEPIVVICWTGHPEIKDAFESRFRTSFSKNKIGTVWLATKPAAEDLFSDETLNHLRELITQGLAEHGPLSLLFAWENSVLKATLLTGDRLTDLITQLCGERENQGSWAHCAFRICASLALAERGLRLARESDTDAVAAFHGALNPLLQDRLDHSLPVYASDAISKTLFAAVRDEVDQRKKNAAFRVEETRRECLISGVWEALGSDLAASASESLEENSPQADSLITAKSRGALNTMILLSSNANGKEVSPGNLYLMDSITNGTKFNQAVPKINWVNIETDTFLKKDRMLDSHWPVLLEFSPPCDFAQAKVRVPRFVAGYLVHEMFLNQVPKQAAFIRIIGPLLLSGENPKIEGIFWLVLNAHFIISAATEYARNWSCFARMRSAALADVTAWITSHMARPGYLHLDA